MRKPWENRGSPTKTSNSWEKHGEKTNKEGLTQHKPANHGRNKQQMDTTNYNHRE